MLVEEDGGEKGKKYNCCIKALLSEGGYSSFEVTNSCIQKFDMAEGKMRI